MEIIIVVIVAVVVGIAADTFSRKKVIGDAELGTNRDLFDCVAICEQLKARAEELCEAQGDERDMRKRWERASTAAISATLVYVALSAAANAAIISVIGIPVGLWLQSLAAAAAVAAIAAGAALASAWWALEEMRKTKQEAEVRFREAERQWETRECWKELPDARDCVEKPQCA